MAPSPDPSPGGEGDTPSPHPTLLSTFGASLLALSALVPPPIQKSWLRPWTQGQQNSVTWEGH